MRTTGSDIRASRRATGGGFSVARTARDLSWSMLRFSLSHCEIASLRIRSRGSFKSGMSPLFPRRVAKYGCAVRYIAGDDRSCAHDRIVTNRDTRQDNRARPYPDIFPDRDGPSETHFLFS